MMKRQSDSTSGNAKVVALPGTGGEANPQWGKTPKRQDTPAPPPVWTRYIDSRLKQFCAR